MRKIYLTLLLISLVLIFPIKAEAQNGYSTGKCTCTSNYGACQNILGYTNIKYRSCTANPNGATTCTIIGGGYYDYVSCSVTTPTATPVPPGGGGGGSCPWSPPEGGSPSDFLLPGSGTIQAQSDFIYSNGTKLKQALWREGKGFSRTVPVVNGEPQWSCANSSPTATPPPSCVVSQGDANRDGSVDGADYSYWLNRQCTTGCATANLVADFNCDNKVDDSDYTIWFNNRQ